MTAAEAVYRGAWRDGWRPEPLLTVSEWSDRYRYLSDVASAEPGRWRTARTPYLREIMDSLSAHNPVRRVVFMKGAQVGGTECGNNWLGYIIHHSPGPTLYVEPTVEVAQSVSKQRLQPMLDDTPVLRGLVADARARDSGNTILMKEFRGGVLMVRGANSGAGLRSMPVRNLFLDEVDEYPGDVDGQGDPVALAEKRTSTFTRKKILLVSTPTVKGQSRIEREYLLSDQRRYFVPCPACGHMDFLTWRDAEHFQIVWRENDPASAAMRCPACKAENAEHNKTSMLLAGEWRATAAGDGRTAGFHLSALYSPLGWMSWAECVAEFVAAKHDVFKLKGWVNTILGETWEEQASEIKPGTLRARAEDEGEWPATVPQKVGVLVASVDTQGDRLEVAVKGFGNYEESWLVAFAQLHGDPQGEKLWADLDAYLAQPFRREDGALLRVECAVVDSGGSATEHVYRYCRVRARRNIFAIKGGSTPGKPLVGRASRFNRYKMPVFILCVDTGRDIVTSRLQIASAGPGFMHLPRWVEDDYLDQLTSTRAVRKYVKGRGAVREWIKDPNRRDEAFDLEVYALAALYIAFPHAEALRTLSDRPHAKPDAAPAAARPAPPRRPWATNY